MKGKTILAAAAAMLALAGCNKAGTVTNATANGAAGNGAASNSATAAANQAAPQTADAGKLNAGGGAIPATSTGTGRLDRTFMLGRWTDDNDCNKAVAFNQDGSFTNADGATGLWNLDGDRLTLSSNRTIQFQVVPIDQNTVTIVHSDGSLGRSTRC